MVVTELGMVTEVSWLSRNALSPMVVTGVPPIVLGIVTFLSKQAILLFLILVRSA